MAVRQLIIASLALIVLSLLVQITGFVTPGWEVISFSVRSTRVYLRVSVRYGLWYTCSLEGCEAGRPDTWDYLTVDRENMLVAQITATIALVLSICSFAGAIQMNRHASSGRPIHSFVRYFQVFACFLAGLLNFVAVGKYGHAQNELCGPELQCPHLFPYSIAIFGVGGILIVVATVLLLTEAAVTRHQQNNGDVRTRSRLDTTNRQNHQMHSVAYPVQYYSRQVRK